MRKIIQCLNHQLNDILQRTLLIEEINIKLISYLPDNLKTHCYAGSFNRGNLVIVASDPVWASQLRYSLPELRDKLRAEAGIYQLSSIKVIVAIVEKITPQTFSNKITLTNNARAIISQSGDECTYLPLKNALHQLAKNKPQPQTPPPQKQDHSLLPVL